MPQTAKMPKWWDNQLAPKFRSLQSHAFNLYGSGTFDYVVAGVTLADYISQTISAKMPIRVLYEPALGFTYPDDLSREEFESWFGETGMDPSVLASVTPENALPLILNFLADDMETRDKNGNPVLEDGKPVRKLSRVVIISRMDLCFSSDPHRVPSVSTINLMHDHCGTSKAISRSGNMLIMLSPSLNDVHESLRDAASGVAHIEVTLPDEDERYKYIHDRIRMRDKKILDEPIIKLEMLEHQLADATSGLSRRNIEDILLAGKTSSVTWDMVNQQTSDFITAEAAGLLKVIKATRGFDDLGGMHQFKSFANECVIDAAHSEDPERRQSMPYVLVFGGPPGTAKSEAAVALGKELKWNVLMWSTLKGELMGQSEHNNDKAMEIIRRRLPALLVWDEADQDGATRSGTDGHSVDQALFRSRLMLLNDTSLRGKLLIVVIANWTNRLDAAMLDRADEIIPFVPAESDQARAEILAALFRKEVGITTTVDAMLPAAAQLDDRWSGRDMKGLVVKAKRLINLHNMTVSNAAVKAAKTRRPSQGSDVQAMTNIALSMTKDEELIPDHYRDRMTKLDKATLDRQIQQSNHDRSFGGERDF